MASQPADQPQETVQSRHRWASLAGRGSLAAVGAYCLFALSAPLTRWLMVHGESHGFDGGSAISFCNLLTIGNLAAAVLVLCLSGWRRIVEGIGRLSWWGRASLLGTSLLSVVTPAAFFFALKLTPVPNVILISRAGPIFFALGGTFLLGRKVTGHQWTGYGFILLAIAFALVFNPESMIGRGDVLALLAALGAAMVSLVGRRALDEMGLKPFVFTRNVLSGCGFAMIALVLFGPMHFVDLFHSEVWVGVSVYGILVVGAAQLLWFYAIVNAAPKTVGGWSFVSPLAAIILTIVLLGDTPRSTQWVALGLVLTGMIIASRGQQQAPNPPAESSLAAT